MNGKMTPEKKQEIDSLSVYDLLSAQRYAPIGDERFQGQEGAYRIAVLALRRSQDNAAYVMASKRLMR
jgi:hypothetical protein